MLADLADVNCDSPFILLSLVFYLFLYGKWDVLVFIAIPKYKGGD